MKKLIIFISLTISLLTGCAVNNASVTNNTDNTDEDRIIATSFAVVEILDKLNLDLIGVPTTSRELPERYTDVTEVGAPMNPDLEIIKTLNSTDIISPATLESTLKQSYENLGLNYTFINLKNLYEMHEDIKELGERYDREEEAQAIIDDFNTFLNQLEQTKNENDALTVLILMGMPGAYVVATENSYVGHLVSLAGGINIFESDTEDFLTISPEEMLEKNPDIILRAAHALPEQVLEMFEEEFKENDIWKYFDAVKNDRVYDLDYELFGMSATLDYQNALEILKDILYNN